MSSKMNAAILLIGLLVGGAAGYYLTPKGISQDQFNALQTQNTALQNQITQLRAEVDQLEGKTNNTETVNLATKVGIGEYFTDSKGFALYYFAKDVPSTGMSAATNQTLAKWTPFYVSPVVTATGINATDFTTITGPNGKPQLSYKGWPLYKFLSDVNPGQTNGEGFNNLWWVMKPKYTLILSYSDELGLHFATLDDKGIYYYTGDVPDSGSINAVSEWTDLFTPFKGTAINVPSTLNPLSFTSTSGMDVASGVQLTNGVAYRGWPLYTYNYDVKPGDTIGDGFNANQTNFLTQIDMPLWFIMKPDYNIMVENNDFQGGVLTDGDGMTLYYNINDKPESPSSKLNTTSLWRPYNSTPTVAPSWLPLDEFKVFNRSDGASQVEFLGWPLYYYVGDVNPGDMKGEGLLGQWYVFDPYNPPG